MGRIVIAEFLSLDGTGKRLFGETSDKKTLRLTDTKTVGDGVVILACRPAARGG
jgi:hypothetical protein